MMGREFLIVAVRRCRETKGRSLLFSNPRVGKQGGRSLASRAGRAVQGSPLSLLLTFASLLGSGSEKRRGSALSALVALARPSAPLVLLGSGLRRAPRLSVLALGHATGRRLATRCGIVRLLARRGSGPLLARPCPLLARKYARSACRRARSGHGPLVSTSACRRFCFRVGLLPVRPARLPYLYS